jgi:glyoxylase-like metal-dependent hydrolase (beta-lactamase superfamily II)
MIQPDQTALPADLRLVDDMHLGRSRVIGTYVLLGDEPALVDPGPTSTLAALEAGLAAHGLALGDLRVLLLTHIHLDHAGATGTLVARHPHLRVYVHQRGAPHLVAPERLLQSATRLYGDEMDRLWGEFRAVPEGNITTLAGGETLRLGGRTLRVYDAPGHASHHVIYFEERSGAAFVGDNGGIHLPGWQVSRPASPPPDIDLEAWDRTLDLLRQLDPRFLLLTHFGPIGSPAGYIEDYRACLRRWAEVVREGLAGDTDEAEQIARLRAYAEAELGREATAEDKAAYQQAAPVELCWHGLARYWRKRGVG